MMLSVHTPTLGSLCYPQKAADLADMINRVIREGLEGLVLKDVKVRGSHPVLAFSHGLSASPSLSSPGQQRAAAAWMKNESESHFHVGSDGLG